MEAEDVNTPDWRSFWWHVPDVSFHEAVMLSLNVDPDAPPSDAIRKTYLRRSELVKRCLGTTLSVKRWVDRGYGSWPQFDLETFAAWSIGVGWDLPLELKVLASLSESTDTRPEPGPKEPTHTGLPGRPSKSRHLIEDEFERRIAAGKVEDSLPGEANALHDWLKRAYPDAQRPTPKTIKDNIRPKYRKYIEQLPSKSPR